VKVLMRPSDERMRELISLRAFGLSELDAVHYYVALKMAERGLVSAPNVAVGEPFNYGITSFACPAWTPAVLRRPRRSRSSTTRPPAEQLMAETLGDRLRSLLAAAVYSSKGRLRADDLLVRERVGRGLGEASARLRDLMGESRRYLEIQA
jgi:hypothetical protein